SGWTTAPTPDATTCPSSRPTHRRWVSSWSGRRNGCGERRRRTPAPADSATVRRGGVGVDGHPAAGRGPRAARLVLHPGPVGGELVALHHLPAGIPRATPTPLGRRRARAAGPDPDDVAVEAVDHAGA